MNLWICEDRKANNWYLKFKADYSFINISEEKIVEMLNILRRYITHYTKDVYYIEDISW